MSTNCEQYMDCESKGTCPQIQTDAASLKKLQQLSICVEKFDANPQKSSKAISGSKFQQAAFLLGTLWEPTDTINISFFPPPPGYPGEQPQWDGGEIIPNPNLSIGVTAAPMSMNACSTDGDCMNSMGGSFLCVQGNCVEDLSPKWYSRTTTLSSAGETLTPEEEEFERKVRSMDPISAIKLVIMEKIQPIVGVKFVFVEDGGDIRIGLNNQDGCWSLVGTQCRTAPSNERTMNFGWLDVATIIHEFGHALGMIHEHQNPFGSGIDWNVLKVFAWANATQGWDMFTTCENIIKKYQITSVNGSEYDPKSIMLYSFPGELTNNNVGTLRNIKLSAMDKEWLGRMYPPNGSERVIQTPSQPNTVAAAGNDVTPVTSAPASGSNNPVIVIAIVVSVVLFIFLIAFLAHKFFINKVKSP